LQAGLDFYLQPDVGYIAFRSPDSRVSRPLVLGDPICNSERKRELLQSFLIKHPNAIFLQTSRITGEILSSIGFSVNEFGIETYINVQDYDLKGRQKAHLRRSMHSAERDKVTVVELPDSPAVRARAREISGEWVKNKAVNSGELYFLTRPSVFEEEMDVRKFYALQDNEIIGFVFFDPVYDNGRVVSYVTNIERCLHDRWYSIIDCIIIHAIEVFKKEGIRELFVGLSPLAGIADSGERGKSLLCFRRTFFVLDHL